MLFLEHIVIERLIKERPVYCNAQEQISNIHVWNIDAKDADSGRVTALSVL